MQHNYWLERWNKDEIGFHRSEVNPFLQKYFKEIPLAPDARALVPLCGKSLDLGYLAAQGLQVAGCELSNIACEQFFAENGLNVHKEQTGKFIRYSHNEITIWCGDFFALGKPQVGTLDFCYDRAALIALPPAMRYTYAQQIRNLLQKNAYYLLVSITYSSEAPLGPPFSVADQEVHQLFADSFKIHLLASEPVPIDTVATLAKKGAFALSNHVYLLQRV